MINWPNRFAIPPHVSVTVRGKVAPSLKYIDQYFPSHSTKQAYKVCVCSVLWDVEARRRRLGKNGTMIDLARM
jgi:hypothetical protein